MAKVKYQGTNKAKVSWNSMGKAYSYNVRPGEVIAIPDDQVNNIRAAGMFSIVSAPTSNNVKPVVRKRIIKHEPDVNESLKVVKVPPHQTEEPEEKEEEVVSEPEEEVVEELVADVEEEEVVSEVEEKRIDYTSIRKADLKSLCKDRGLRTNGNRDDLIMRLAAYDKGEILDC